MRKVLADTVEYAKQRHQFGQPIGSFQGLQHRMVDMYMEVEQAVAAVYLAVLNLDAEPAVRARAVSAAKATIGRARPLRRAERRPAARRYGHDRGARDRALLQAADRDAVRVRLDRPPRRPVRGADDAVDPRSYGASISEPASWAHTKPMLNLRILAPTRLTDDVIQTLKEDPCVSGLAVVREAAIEPTGDLVFADVAREAANEVIGRLRALGLHHEGTIEIQPVTTWLSSKGFDCEVRAPGSSADAVVWAEVAQRSYEETELNWTYLSFMTLATTIAAIAIILDSQILVIGAMVLGPEFGAVAALGVALVRRRFALLGLAVRTLVLGFIVAIASTTVLAFTVRALGWATVDDVVEPPGHRLYLHAGQVVVYRCCHRRDGRSPVSDFEEGQRPKRRVHFRNDRAGRGKHRPGYRLRRRRRDLGQHYAASGESVRYGRGWLGSTGVSTGRVVEGVASPSEGDDTAETHALTTPRGLTFSMSSFVDGLPGACRLIPVII